MIKIDINTDCGEGFPEDEQLLRHVTSANIACGSHAGDPELMRKTIRCAHRNKVSIGAHPSFPDRDHFGRQPMKKTPEEIQEIVAGQLKTLNDIAVSEGTHLMHVKLHGALYHKANEDYRIAEAVCRAIAGHDTFPILIGQPGTFLERAARLEGLLFAREAFADRAYRKTGELVPRSQPDALLTDPKRAAEQALDIVIHNRVRAVDGTILEVHADTLCIHSDTPGAAHLAEAIVRELKAAKARITPLHQLFK